MNPDSRQPATTIGGPRIGGPSIGGPSIGGPRIGMSMIGVPMIGVASLLVAVVMLATSGCSGSSSSSSAKPPNGYITYQGDGYSFAYPARWQVLSGSARFVANAAIEVAGPKSSTELPALISAFVDTVGGTLSQRVGQLNTVANIELPARTVIRTSNRTIAGGKGQVVESEYDQALRSGGTARVTQWDLIAVSPSGRTVDLRMAAPTSDLASVTTYFDTAMATLHFGPAVQHA